MALTILSVSAATFVSILGWRRYKGLNNGTDDFIQKNEMPFHGFGPFGWLLIVMMMLTALSLIPMPLGMLEILSPAAADWYRESWALAGLDRDWGYLSAATGRSAFALWGLIGYFGIYVFALRLGGTRGNLQKISYVLAVAGFMMLGMLGMKYLGISISFGSRGETAAWHIGLPVNSNHAAGVFAFLSMMSLGNFTSKRHKNALARRGLWLLLYALFGVAMVLLKSRGALFAWGCGHVIVILYYLANAKEMKWKTGAILLSAFGAILIAVTLIAAPTIGSIKAEFQETDISFNTSDDTPEYGEQVQKQLNKTQLYGDFVDMGRAWGRAGTGRSAFSEVYPGYQSFSFPKRFRHAENEYWEILLEYGWFWGTVCLLIGAIGLYLFLRKFWHEPKERGLILGLLAGIIVLLIQNLFDFSLRYWTTGMLFWIGCGIVEARRRRWQFGSVEDDHTTPDRKRRIEWIAGNAIAAVAIVTAVISTSTAIDGHKQTGIRELRAEVTKSAVESPQVQSLIEKNMSIRAGNTHVRAIVANALLKQANLDTNSRITYWESAKAWYQSAVNHSPRNAELTIHLAKLCFALNDETCASEYFLKTAIHDHRMVNLAMQEMSALKYESIALPEPDSIFSALVRAMIDRGRYDDVQKMIAERKKTSPVLAARLECLLYTELNMNEACNIVLDDLNVSEMTIELFDLQFHQYARQKEYGRIFELISRYESLFNSDAIFIERKLEAYVFWGLELKGEDWYRNSVNDVLTRYRKLTGRTVRERFTALYFEAQYALNLKQYGRAQRCATDALKLRPGHRGATLILNQVNTESTERIKEHR
ncbi:MAG: O-antigen ligase family protein [Proteobacteria bacterium]|nr:O-antigen ligase family protein [Pseudomonadota bacterium]